MNVSNDNDSHNELQNVLSLETSFGNKLMVFSKLNLFIYLHY